MRTLIILFLFTAAQVYAQDYEKKQVYDISQNTVQVTYLKSDNSIYQKGQFNTKGNLNGEWVIYDEDGKVKVKAHYENGRKTGEWFYRTEHNQYKITYVNNEIQDVLLLPSIDKIVMN